MNSGQECFLALARHRWIFVIAGLGQILGRIEEKCIKLFQDLSANNGAILSGSNIKTVAGPEVCKDSFCVAKFAALALDRTMFIARRFGEEENLASRLILAEEIECGVQHQP